ncbi:aldehyde dehydrogenase [Suipraeoptans intestinalis]|uniref:aldehyde dehydrogenase n=1 Tax=Suipraeoptans intestinalis TaxID=2606628 RepID=UPI002A75C9BC|nr:aldehyde dehydrogenase [Suipraeoptans intestinalis]MDY3121662.1 aldehyde dehydrogenase [Suipraeoptans intestinalis]
MERNMVEKIVEKQREFFHTDQTKDIGFRIRQLKKLKDAIRQKEDRILEALYLDLGKSKTEAFMTEVAMVYSEIDTALKQVKKWSRPRRVWGSIGTFPSVDYVYSEPYGIVLIMSPWNYPFNLTMSPLVAAMAAGNCAVLKCSRTSLHTANVMKEILDETFERRYISCLEIDTAYDAVLHQKYDYIFFTGSPSVGKKVMSAASQHLIPVSLELGGKSPCMIEESADIRLAAKRIAWGKFLNAGQTCISIDYVLIHESVKEKFIRELKRELEERYDIGSKTYPRIINRHHFDRLCELIRTEEHVIGGQTDEAANKIAPTIFPDSDFDREIMKEEIFGPLLPVISYRRLEEVIRKVKELEKPLACYLFTNRKEVADQVIHSISYGGGCINDVVVHFTNHRLPFGGVGLSGIGSYHGKYGFDALSHKKGVVKSIRGIDVPFRYQPFDDKKWKLFKKIF